MIAIESRTPSAIASPFARSDLRLVAEFEAPSFRWIALPLALPGVATTAILCLVFSWNDYAFVVTFSGPESATLSIAASQLVTQTSIYLGQLTAIGTIVVAPMILVGLIVRSGW